MSVRKSSRRAVRLFAKLTKLVESFGGKVLETDDEDEKLNCPFESYLGVDWRRKIMYVKTGTPITMRVVVSAIHEIGHLFACDKEPNRADDEYGFLGWEILLAKKSLQIPLSEWRKNNSEYIVGMRGESLGDLTPTQFRAEVKNRLGVAEKNGLISNGQLRTVR